MKLGAILLSGILAVNANAAELFSVDVPKEIVTGRVHLQANVQDPKVKLVKWRMGNWSKRTPQPFEIDLALDAVDTSGLPHQQVVYAEAYDEKDQLLYNQEIVLNGGGRSAYLEFVTPAKGQQVTGKTTVKVRPHIPSYDSLEKLVVTYDNKETQMQLSQDGTYAAEVELSVKETIIDAYATTKQGTYEKYLVVNAQENAALHETIDVHYVEQMMHIAGDAQNLIATDFTVNDGTGKSVVKEIKRINDTPLYIGLVVSANSSARFNFGLEKATIISFMAKLMKPKDTAFVYAYGPFSRLLLPWSQDQKAIGEKLNMILPITNSCESLLYDTTIKGLYEFQGGHGASALILIGDGYDYGVSRNHTDCTITVGPDGTPAKDNNQPQGSEASVDRMLEYAKQAGVPIYPIGISTKASQNGSDPTIPVIYKSLLDRIAQASNGRAFYANSPEDLPKIFSDLEAELRHEYMITYTTHVKESHTFHPVKIESAKVKVKTNAGFFY